AWIGMSLGARSSSAAAAASSTALTAGIVAALGRRCSPRLKLGTSRRGVGAQSSARQEARQEPPERRDDRLRIGHADGDFEIGEDADETLVDDALLLCDEEPVVRRRVAGAGRVRVVEFVRREDLLAELLARPDARENDVDV